MCYINKIVQFAVGKNMKVFFYCFLVVSSLAFCDPQTKNLQEYLDMVQSYNSSIGVKGDANEGEIELLKDAEKIKAAMIKTGRDVGIVYKDRYWIWANDPVLFPSGQLGVYGRIISRSSLKGKAGCALLARFKDGKIALNCNFRHATRTWELEIPRGFVEEGESAEEGAKREVLEETGCIIGAPIFLGDMPPDTGQSNALVAIFTATIEECGKAQMEESEAIDSIVPLSLKELKKGLLEGYLYISIHNKKKKVFLRDPFLTYALIQMEIRGLLH